MGVYYTYSLHCSSFLGLPFRILNIDSVKPKKWNYNGDYRYHSCTKETRGMVWVNLQDSILKSVTLEVHGQFYVGGGGCSIGNFSYKVYIYIYAILRGF